MKPSSAGAEALTVKTRERNPLEIIRLARQVREHAEATRKEARAMRELARAAAVRAGVVREKILRSLRDLPAAQ